jgi:hypothetical protein
MLKYRIWKKSREMKKQNKLTQFWYDYCLYVKPVLYLRDFMKEIIKIMKLKYKIWS